MKLGPLGLGKCSKARTGRSWRLAQQNLYVDFCVFSTTSRLEKLLTSRQRKSAFLGAYLAGGNL